MKKHRILLIEDDPFISKVYQRWLVAHGFEVHAASNGALGLQVFEHTHLDLILLDLGMPGLDGIKTLEELRQTEAGRRVTVIVLTNTSLERGGTVHTKLQEAGVKVTCTKYNISLNDLLNVVTAQLPGPQQS